MNCETVTLSNLNILSASPLIKALSEIGFQPGTMGFCNRDVTFRPPGQLDPRMGTGSTHKHTHTHAHTNTRTHANTHTHTHTHTKHKHTHIHTHTHTHTLAQTHTHAHTRKHTYLKHGGLGQDPI